MGMGGKDDDKMKDPMKAAKKKMWKVCHCGCGWTLFGIFSLCVGIALVVVYHEFWGNDEEWERGLAYAGVALICLGVLLLALGIMFCAIICILYNRMSTEHGTVTMFHPPKFEYGKAPYPQQKPYHPENPDGHPSPNPSAPNAPHGGKPTHPGEVRVEIKDHTKM